MTTTTTTTMSAEELEERATQCLLYTTIASEHTDVSGETPQFPKSVNQQPIVNQTTSSVYREGLRDNMAKTEKILLELQQDMQAVTGSSHVPCTTTTTTTTMSARDTAKNINKIKLNLKELLGVVKGLKQMFISDLVEGALPPLIYSEALRYGVDVPQLCPTCSQPITERKDYVNPDKIAEFLSSFCYTK